MSEFFVSIVCDDCEEFSVVIEDDGRVAYAYLLENTAIIGQVWLYNQVDTPKETTWDEDQMPFLNPLEFVGDSFLIKPIEDNVAVQVKWKYLDTNKSIEAHVFIRKELVAILRPNAEPGWSLMVNKDGPLAKKWIM